MGHKWLEAFSKAVTYLGSGVTAPNRDHAGRSAAGADRRRLGGTAAYAGCGRRVRGIHSAGRADG